MKTPLRICLAAVLLSILAVAHSTPPASSGTVIRFNDTIPTRGFGAWVDHEAGTLTILGADMFEFCAGTFNFDTVPIMVVMMEDGVRFKSRMSGQVQASVWPFTNFDCALFTIVPPIATGFVKMRINDNDMHPLLNPDNHNVNAFQVTAHGVLTGWTSGESMRFALVEHGMWDGDDFSTFRGFTKIKLH